MSDWAAGGPVAWLTGATAISKVWEHPAQRACFPTFARDVANRLPQGGQAVGIRSEVAGSDMAQSVRLLWKTKTVLPSVIWSPCRNLPRSTACPFSSTGWRLSKASISYWSPGGRRYPCHHGGPPGG